MTVLILLLLLLLTFIKGVSPQKLKEIYVKSGDMEVLRCGECQHSDTLTIWKKVTDRTTFLYSNMSAAEQRQLGVVVHENCLVILSASMSHQGDYSCDRLRKDSSPLLFRLTVYTTRSKEYEEKNQYNFTCYTHEACSLNCPGEDIPDECFPNITLKSITWNKNGEPAEDYFPSAEGNISGVYICTQSYVYSAQIYNMSFTVVLDVQKGSPVKNLGISFPDNGQVFEVELGKRVEIVCKALVDTCQSSSSLFWLDGEQFVEEDHSRIYNNSTCDALTTQLTAALVFTEVLEEDLSKTFTCKHESDIKPAYVTITLTEKARPSYTALAVCITFIVVVMALTVVIYVRFKVDITLFFRDFIGCQSSSSDGKVYDAFLMCYKSDTGRGLNEGDRKLLENTLEEQFGYKLCLYDRDVLPGHAEAEAVLDTVEQSRAVVLVPCGPDPGPGTGLLSVIHEALVERKTHLILINTEQTEDSDSLPEALQLLSEAGDCITWKGSPPPPSFWKELRYHLPALQPARKSTHQLLTQTVI